MNDNADMADIASDLEKHSRRDRWKDAISRTKSKFNKKEKEVQEKEHFQLSDDVNDFLAAGRKPAVTTTVRSVPDAPQAYDASPRRSPRPSTSESIGSGQPSPRGPYVPRLDITQSQRWPNARPVETDPRSRSDDHLTPNYNDRLPKNERSHSLNSALAKNRGRPRGLSVSFTNSPPVIIGIGGDKAETPTFEISRAKNRSRSLSPYLDRPVSHQSNSSDGRSPVTRKPVPSPSPSPTFQNANTEREDSIFQPKPVRRVQTGWAGQQLETPFVPKSLEQQIQEELSLQEQQRQQDLFVEPQVHHNAPISQPARFPSLMRPAKTKNQMMNSQNNDFQFNSALNDPSFQAFLDNVGKEPPKVNVRNFYADINRPDSGRGVESGQERDNYMERVSASLKRQPTFPHVNQNVAELPASPPKRGQAMKQQPPPGWI